MKDHEERSAMVLVYGKIAEERFTKDTLRSMAVFQLRSHRATERTTCYRWNSLFFVVAHDHVYIGTLADIAGFLKERGFDRNMMVKPYDYERWMRDPPELKTT